MNQVAIPLYENLISGFNHTGNAENEVVQKVRRKGLENFQKLGFPTRRNEDWKYTSVTPFLQDDYQLDGMTKNQSASSALIAEAAISALDSYQLVIINGQLQKNEVE